VAKSPAITVLMAACNAEDIVGESVEAILGQDFTDFEFIIINDGSSDQTLSLLNSYAKRDKRIRVIDQENTGLTRALNRGLKSARGQLIARIDADDIAMPDRLTRQYDVMSKSADILLTGGKCISIFPKDKEVPSRWISEEKLRKAVFFNTPFAHSTAMFRRDAAKKLGWYDESFITSQDMEFWMRFMKEGRVVMINHPLIRRYVGEDSISVKRRWRQFYDAARARWLHNSIMRLPYTLYYACRGLIIILMPESILIALKRRIYKNDVV
jgi:glycosyltransferase involved in cell wall biosynthesis